MRKNRIFTTTKNTKNPNLLGSLPTPIQKSWVCHCCAPVLKMKSRRLCICVSCHFVCILLGSFCDHCKNVWYNLFSGRPSKVLHWSWLKSLGLGLGTRSLGLGLGLEVQSLGLGLDKKVLFTSLRIFPVNIAILAVYMLWDAMFRLGRVTHSLGYSYMF